MVAETAEDACLGAQSGEVLQTDIERIAMERDHVAGYERQMRGGLVRQRDAPREFLLA